MGLGRITRFASTPAGSRRVNVMRSGRAGVKALAPPEDLFADFSRAIEIVRSTLSESSRTMKALAVCEKSTARLSGFKNPSRNSSSFHASHRYPL